MSAEPSTTSGSVLTGVWSELIGQEHVVEYLARAANAAHNFADAQSESTSDYGMAHTWLLTGPPGSGRATSARAFAAALACDSGGCGSCHQCRLVLGGAHPDVDVVVPTAVQYRADEIRALVDQAQMMPTLSSWLVIIIEDADRLNDASANALLKALEEPTPHTVWMLLAPSSSDVLPTIASRARHLTLRTPIAEQVIEVLEQITGVDRPVAELAARASQGHIGRARALATDPLARERRTDVLSIPGSLRSLSACFAAAKVLVDTAQADADAICEPLNDADDAALAQAFGDGAEGKGIGTLASRSRGEAGRLKRAQEARARRVLRDQFERVLLDLTGFYRDAIILQSAAGVALINPDQSAVIERVAGESSVDASALRLAALRQASQRLRANAAPLLVFESLLVSLWRPQVVADRIRDTVAG